MPPEQHARLGGSGAHRWMKCPGSVRLSEGIEEQTSEYAAEGTVAHAVAEMALGAGIDAGEYVGVSVGTDIGEIVVTQEMADAVQVYLDYLRRPSFAGADEVHVELRISLEALDPPEPMYGTADAVAWDPETRTLDVVDYKHGRGVVVEIERNEQLLFYALGAVLALKVKPDTIRTTIVQPRASHPDGPIRTAEYSWEELVAFKDAVIDAAREVNKPDAPVGPVGDHCKFCPAKAICPAQRENALVVAQAEFTDIEEASDLPPPARLSDDQILEVLDKARFVEDWINDIRSYVQARLEAGDTMPGWKLVEKRKTRRWRDKEEAAEWLRKRFPKRDVYNEKLVSPYQAEQLLKDRPKTELPEEFVIAKSSGLKLAHESNPRPAITPESQAVEEFAALTDGDMSGAEGSRSGRGTGRI